MEESIVSTIEKSTHKVTNLARTEMLLTYKSPAFLRTVVLDPAVETSSFSPNATTITLKT